MNPLLDESARQNLLSSFSQHENVLRCLIIEPLYLQQVDEGIQLLHNLLDLFAGCYNYAQVRRARKVAIKLTL
jgi:hypothetical protein